MSIPTIGDLTSKFQGLGAPESDGNWRRFPISSAGLTVNLRQVSDSLFGEDLVPGEFPITALKLLGLRMNSAVGQEELQFSVGGTTGTWSLIPSFLEVSAVEW